MNLFGGRKTKGISNYELDHERLKSRLGGVFPNNDAGKRKRAAFFTALEIALDRDTNMSASQKYGVVQPEEFEKIISGLQGGDVISSSEAEELRTIAKEALAD
jgi:hypothetical protein